MWTFLLKKLIIVEKCGQPNIEHPSLGEIEVFLHADNCVDQNKNSTTMHYSA